LATTLELLTPGARVRGLLAYRPVKVVQAEWHGGGAVTLTYTNDGGRPGQALVYRDDEARLEIESPGKIWSLDADGQIFRLVYEAKRISLAHLFDPFLAREPVEDGLFEPAGVLHGSAIISFESRQSPIEANATAIHRRLVSGTDIPKKRQP